MKMSKLKIRAVQPLRKNILLTLALSFLVHGCIELSGPKSDKSGSVNGNGESFLAPIYRSAQGPLCSGDDLSAEVVVDRDTDRMRTEKLIVDCEAKTVQGKIPKLTLGLHTFKIIYYKNSNVEVATISTQADIVAGSNILDFADFPFIFPDSDNDGYSNMAELNFYGVDSMAWDDPDIRPKAQFLKNSANYSMIDQVGSLFISSEATSDNYCIEVLNVKTKIGGIKC